MIRERTRCRKNLFHRMLSMMLVFGLAAASVLGGGRGIRAASGDGTVIYLDGASGDDSRDGKSEKEAVATFSKAKKLVGDKGTIRVCGTVTVSGSQHWSLGSGVKLKRASGFTDALAHVTGSLELSGITLYNTDVSGSGSVSGLAGRSPASEISVPSAITLVQPKALSEVSLSDQCFGSGSFAWANGSFVPDKYETQAQIIFTPSDTDVHDYSGLKGWNGDSQTVIRTVKVLTQSFLDEEKNEDDPDDAEASEDADKDKTETGGQAGEDGKEDGAESGSKPEDGSGKEDGKTDDVSGEEEQKPEDGKTDDVSGEEEQKPEDGKTDDVSGEEEQKPDSDPGQEEQKPEDGKTDTPDGTDAENPEEGDGKDAPAEDQSPADGSEDPEDGSGTDNPAGEDKPEDGADSEESGEKPDAEEKEDEPAETWNAEKVARLLAKLPESIGSQADVEAVVRASVAFEQLSEEAQAEVSGELLDKLYDAQSRVLGYNRVSQGVTVQGDLPWYIQFRATAVEGRKVDDSTIRTLLESYEFKLWNLITDSEYKLNGKTVTVLMAAPAVKDVDIVIYHYLADGTVEQIIPEISGDQMSFVTSSFSPFSVIGLSVAGSTELVGSTGFSYIDKEPGTGGESSSTGNKNPGSSSTGNKSSGSSSAGNKNTSSSAGKSSSSTTSSSSTRNRTTSTGTGNTGVRRANAVGTGDTNNLMGYAMVGSGAIMLMLFAGYMVYVQYKRKSYSRRS